MTNCRFLSGIKVFTVLLVFLFVVAGSALAFDPVAEFEPVDFEGATITYMCWYDPYVPFEEGHDYAGRLKEAKERFNIGEFKLLEVSWGDLSETGMSRLMGGDATHDIWFLPNTHIWPMAAGGAFYPVGDILPDEYYDALPSFVRPMFDEIMIKGQKFGFGLGNDHVENITYMLWNKDIFERDGLTPLDELYEAGEWTWETMEEIAVQATRDTTADDEIDQYGIGNINILDMVLANDGEIVTRDDDGRYIFTMPDCEAAHYALEKVVEWVHGLAISDGTWDIREFVDGTRAMAPAEAWQFAPWSAVSGMEDEWGIVPMPKGPHAEDIRFPVRAMDSVFLPATAEDPEALIALHNFLFPFEEQLMEREEQVIAFAPDETSSSVLQRALDEFTTESAFLLEAVLGDWYDGDRAFGEALWQIQWGGQSPASALEAAKSAVQAELDEFFE